MSDAKNLLREALAQQPARIDVGEVRDLSANDKLSPWRGGKDDWD